MEKLYQTARNANRRFPGGNHPFQIMTRLLEECGEVASQVNLWEGTGIKRQKHGEPDPKALAGEIRQAMTALAQLALYYGLKDELAQSIEASLEQSRRDGLMD